MIGWTTQSGSKITLVKRFGRFTTLSEATRALNALAGENRWAYVVVDSDRSQKLGRRIVIPRSALEYGPRVNIQVDIDELARALRLQELKAQRQAIDIEISQLEIRRRRL